MLISLARLTEDGLRFNHQYKTDELDLSDHEFVFREPPLVSGRVERAGADVRVRGTLRASLEMPCDRCLDPVPFDLDFPFDLFYTSSEYEKGKKGEAEVRDHDLDFSVYSNDEINIDDAVLEQLELSFPARVLCRESCEGLCLQCGTNLNAEKCECRPPVDPRWQALAEMKKKMDGEE
ncbi:MAG: YceD family protein [Blastocatellia bacterium]